MLHEVCNTRPERNELARHFSGFKNVFAQSISVAIGHLCKSGGSAQPGPRTRGGCIRPSLALGNPQAKI